MTIHIIPRLSVGAGVECSPVASIPTLRVHAQSSSESPPVWRSRQRDEDSRSTLPRTPRWPRSDPARDRKSTRLNSSHGYISYAVFCLKKKNIDALVHVQLVVALQLHLA